ncbi:MAG TPA: mannose-6-phosphate isomerase, class I, partial [Jatrophihabitantaceae bacterium]|nr:mannose-6-phosphate isomerase, class I [Jatrophihabitantaceae bacterium]
MTAPEVIRIEGVARHYAWGSPTAIPQLLGLEADGTPVAELWFGAHPGDPSPVPDLGTTLDDVIASDPVQLLGSDVARRFGNRMPFLVKVLAADVALSIQVHPTIEQAREGFSSEEARGIPRDAPERNYRDDNHKPELLCALTPFEALCGFRPVAQTLEVLDALDIAELRPLRDLLAGPDGLRAAFTALLQHPEPTSLVAAVSDRALASDDDRLRAQRLLTDDFPGDIGIVLSLLLNHVRLEPGDAIFLRAGNVHSYLRGTGIEIMAN